MDCLDYDNDNNKCKYYCWNISLTPFVEYRNCDQSEFIRRKRTKDIKQNSIDIPIWGFKSRSKFLAL